MYTIYEHMANLTRHINLVRDNCHLLGMRLIAQGEHDFGRLLIARGFVHDASKFYGIEWDYLHVGPDVSHDNLNNAIKQHVRTNEHHPEFWGGVQNMPRIAIAEMVCDWYARSQEFGTDLKQWVIHEAMTKFSLEPSSQAYKHIAEFVSILLNNSFKT